MRIGRMLAAVAGGLVVAATPLAAAGAAPTPDRSALQETTVTQPKTVGDADAMRRTCRSNHAGTYVCFKSKGDHFILKDTAKDGYSAAVYWEVDYDRKGHDWGVCINKHGKGSVVDCNYNMKEGQTVTFWAVNVNLPTNTYVSWSKQQSAII